MHTRTQDGNGHLSPDEMIELRAVIQKSEFHTQKHTHKNTHEYMKWSNSEQYPKRVICTYNHSNTHTHTHAHTHTYTHTHKYMKWSISEL